MKNSELGMLYNALLQLREACNKEELGVKFRYFVLKNISKIESEIKILQEALKPEPGFDVYNKERIEICERYAEKDKDGKPKRNNHNFLIEKDKQEEFNKEIEELNTKNKELIDRQKEKEKIIEEECDVQFHRIKLDSIPNSKAVDKEEIMISLMPLIDA